MRHFSRIIPRVALLLFVFSTSYLFGGDLATLFLEPHGVPDPRGICTVEYVRGQGPKCVQLGAKHCPAF
jgi:hypothetical protein